MLRTCTRRRGDLARSRMQQGTRRWRRGGGEEEEEGGEEKGGRSVVAEREGLIAANLRGKESDFDLPFRAHEIRNRDVARRTRCGAQIAYDAKGFDWAQVTTAIFPRGISAWITKRANSIFLVALQAMTNRGDGAIRV